LYNHMQKMFIIIICANKFQMKTCDFHIVIQFLIIKVSYLVLLVCGMNSTKTFPSVETFKKKLNSNLKKVPEYFHIGNRKENIALCQIRNEASNLNLHLYDQHLTDRINCPTCPCETPAHFFMHCPEYNNQRQTLKNTFTKLNINFNLQTILNGCETLNYHQNEELVLDIQLFIKNSKRF
jgi:hypothetical protein